MSKIGDMIKGWNIYELPQDLYAPPPDARPVADLLPGDPIWFEEEICFIDRLESDPNRANARHIWVYSCAKIHCVRGGIVGYAGLFMGECYVPTPEDVGTWLNSPEHQGVATVVRARFPGRYGSPEVH